MINTTNSFFPLPERPDGSFSASSGELKIDSPAEQEPKAETARPKKPAEPRTRQQELEGLKGAIVTGDGLRKLEVPPIKRLLDQWLAEGDLGYIFAARGTGKTWFAMLLPACVAGGRDMGLWKAGEHRARVLYIDGEMPLRLTQDRHRGLDIEGVDYLHHEVMFDKLGTSINIARDEDRKILTDMVVELGYDFIVLDNRSALFGSIPENDQEKYEPVAQWVIELRRRKITVIIIHHAGRNGAMRGHSRPEDPCAWVIELKNLRTDQEEGAHFSSHFAKPSRNTQKEMPDLVWRFRTGDDGRVEVRCELAAVEKYEIFIRHVSEGMDRQKDIAQVMGVSKGQVSKWVGQAVTEGRIKREGQRLLPAGHWADLED